MCRRCRRANHDGGAVGGAALLGAHTVNTAAITAAICLAEDVHPDRSQRWTVGVGYGAAWLVLMGPPILQLRTAPPPELLAAVVGLALLTPLTGTVRAAVAAPPQRFAALVTPVVAASGAGSSGSGPRSRSFWPASAFTERLRRPARV